MEHALLTMLLEAANVASRLKRRYLVDHGGLLMFNVDRIKLAKHIKDHYATPTDDSV